MTAHNIRNVMRYGRHTKSPYICDSLEETLQCEKPNNESVLSCLQRKRIIFVDFEMYSIRAEGFHRLLVCGLS